MFDYGELTKQKNRKDFQIYVSMCFKMILY